MNGTETIAEAGPYPDTSPHDGNAHRIRALFHRPAGSGRPARGDTLVVPKLDRLARSVPDARAIADRLRERGVKLALCDPGDPMGKMFFNILATFAEFEADLIRMRTREGMAIARAKGEIARQAAQTLRPTAAGTLPHACHRRVFHQRSR